MSDEAFILYEEDVEKIDACLSKLLKGSEAKCALLVDKDGHLITRQGFTHSLDTTALGALLAGSFASTCEIARLVGETEFSVLFHQGKKDHIHMSIIGERSIMAIVFDDRTTIGMVRLYAKETSTELARLFDAFKTKDRPQGVGSDFSDEAQSKMDDIFQD